MVLCVSCPRQAVFNFPGVKTEWRCGTHKEPGMQNEKVRMCKAVGCTTQATWKLPDAPPDFCSKHKPEGYVYRNGTLNKCQADGCSVNASYGQEGSKVRVFCGKHREPGMVMVGHRTCEHAECSKQPVFGFEKPPRFCRDHREPGMTDLFTKKCEHDGCARIQPTFNFKNELKGRFCLEHKLDGMVCVIRNWCREEGCEISAGFNFDGLKPVYCGEHKKEGMIAVTKFRECEKCDKMARYNLPDTKPARFCRAHRESGMVDTNRLCASAECTKQASFNYEGRTKRLYCFEHKKAGMINLALKYCLTPMCETSVTSKYEGYCFRCYMYRFPDAPVTRRYKTKEMAVRDFLKSSFPDVPFIHDKRVECHMYRPDFVYDFGSHVVVIEVDEYQHETYDTSCDNKRLVSIFQGLGSRPMVMIRFNPDAYEGVKGCWTRTGALVDQGRPWRKRLGTLKDRLVHWFETVPEREIMIEHLFY